MNIEKKVISKLTKCYSIAPLTYRKKRHFLVAAEKTDKCLLFDEEGNEEEVVWEQPGGVMTMVQVPGTDGQFLATHKFYSPNDSREAKIVSVTPEGGGKWAIRTLVDLPFVHRFDILTRNGVNYLIACVLKSGHEYREDWRFPGKVYGAVLPEKLDEFDKEHPLELTVLQDHMLRNHGYYRMDEDGVPTGLVSCDSGVYKFIPPENRGADWKVEQILAEPASDAVLVDFDEDGEKELAVIAPFHGDKIRFYKKKNGKYSLQYEFPESREFLHSIYGGNCAGKQVLIIGHRKKQRDLMMFWYEKDTEQYAMEYIDRDCGSANIYHYMKDGADMLVSANREIDEVALYKLS